MSDLAPRQYEFSWKGPIRDVLRGSGQAMFQCNAWSGLLILAGIFWAGYWNGNPWPAWGGLVGLIVATLAGWIMGADPKDGEQGLWGFNGILVGCAIPTFLANTWLMWAGLVFMAAMSTWMRQGFNNVYAQYKINSLTFPFVFLCWVFFLASRMFAGTPSLALSQPVLDAVPGGEIDWSFWNIIIYWLKGLGQVYFCNSWVTGIFFLVALAISSIWAAVYAALASFIGLFTAIVFQANASDIMNGLFGFCPVLTAIALGTAFHKVGWRSALWTLAAVFATVLIQAAMDAFFTPFGLPTLTGPFCVATWLFLLPLYNLDPKKVSKVEKTPDHRDWTSDSPVHKD